MQKFTPPFWLKNAHMQTILPSLLQTFAPKYARTLIKDSLDQSDIAIDFYHTKDNPTDTLIVLFHGMEGSSQSHYAKTLAKHAQKISIDFAVVHFRSCGGVNVAGEIFYNAHDTQEIAHALAFLAKSYANIYAIGVSLGGNALANHLGKDTLCANLRAAAVISAPLDMTSSAQKMEHPFARKVYMPYLLNPILKKALDNRLKNHEIEVLKRAKTFAEFDEVFTAPRHGFRSKNDYYHQASALPHLHKINLPTLILGAYDDPFVGITPQPSDISPTTTLHYQAHGGHVGFIDFVDGKFVFDYLACVCDEFFSKHGLRQTNT